MKYTAVDSAQMCDECGRNGTKIWRVENKHKYCANCYARVFKRTICPSCGNLARLNKYNKNAICAACIRAKPCARCGKTEYQSGKLTRYGMVCNSCAPHFRDKEPCEVCGTLSNRLTRISRMEHDLRICPMCARADYAICQACKRHRLLSLSDGRMLCNSCQSQGEIPCTKCQQMMPAGRGKACELCYWKGLLEKRTSINCAAFTTSLMADHFNAFAIWLGQDVGAHKAAITLNRYLPFFLDIEKQFKTIPDYDALLQHLGAAKLRKVLLPMRWMEVIGLIIVDAVTREENTEKRRIVALLDKVGKTTKQRKVMDEYHRLFLSGLNGHNTTIRSIRLALSPAVAVLQLCSTMDITLPNQKALDTFLDKTPGQRAAILGFVNYLRNTHQIKITIPKLSPEKAKRNRMNKLKTEMLELMRKGGEDEEFRRQWLSVSLAYFHGLPKKTGRFVNTENILDTGDGGLTVIWHGLKYWVKLNSTKQAKDVRNGGA